MKPTIFYFLLIIVLANVACIKEAGFRPPQKRYDEQPVFPEHPSGGIDNYLPPPRTCINSFDEFIKVFGKAELAVDSVELANGEHLSGGIINKITYHALRAVQSASIFRSQLTVVYNSSGYLQEFFQDIWTLGCLYTNSTTPPFTNILYRGRYYVINTCFTWGGPPQPQNHLSVKYLYIE